MAPDPNPTDEIGGRVWSGSGMTHTPRFDHLGITVADLDLVADFFVALGLEVGGRMFIEGEFIDTVCGIPGARTEILGLNFPGGGTWLELARFIHPDHTPGSPDAMANELGLRNIGLEVEDIEVTVAMAAEHGYGLVGGIGEYEGTWKQAYVRGPEGIVVSVAQRIG
jgi:catechol 2,3-dioxygenase-like lactoylglutathione lyase family enzyme